jgi:hypothetical protein
MSEGAGGFSLTSAALPDGPRWVVHHTSRPRRAYDHMSQTEVGPAVVDRLRPSDTPPDSPLKLVREVPIVVSDTFDAYWAFERILNKLNGFGRSPEEAKAQLVTKLAGHFKLLSRLESPTMAPMLQLELQFLRAVLAPNDGPEAPRS